MTNIQRPTIDNCAERNTQPITTPRGFRHREHGCRPNGGNVRVNHLGVRPNCRAGMVKPQSDVSQVVELFDDESAAAYIGGITARTIRDWRTRRGLPFIRFSAKVCRIRKADLDKWIGRHAVAITR